MSTRRSFVCVLFVLILFSVVVCAGSAQLLTLVVDGQSRALALWVNGGGAQDSFDVFNTCAFEFPKMLAQAQKAHVPVVLIIPEQYKGFRTTDENAPVIEGSRVALAWASAYYRFTQLGNVDVRVVTVPEKLDERVILTDVSKKVLEADLANLSGTPEQKMAGRFFDAAKYEGERAVCALRGSWGERSLEDFKLVDEPVQKIVIVPKFTEYQAPGRRILVTGGAGMIGCHMVRALLARGYQVIVLDNLVCSAYENIAEFEKNKNFEFYNVDVTKPFDVQGPLYAVVHLASIPSPAFYYVMPVETLKTGLNGTKNTLELVRAKHARFLFSSTSEVYGDPEISPQVETYPGRVSPIGKRSQYDQSKRGAETLIKLYFEKYGIDIRVARIFNTYGPGMQLDDGRVVTNFIQAILEHKPMVLYGTGQQTRSFCYVDDQVDGLLMLLDGDMSDRTRIEDRIFNVGNPGEFTIVELAQKARALAKKYLDTDAEITAIANPDMDDPKQRRPDITRINKFAGFWPKVSLDDGFEKTFLYFKGLWK